MKNIIILYHADCPDGFGAAWAARKKFGNKAEYIGCRYDEPLLPMTKFRNKDVYFLDFRYPNLEFRKILIVSKSLKIIDHHIGSKPLLKIMPRNIFFDLKHSGAVLTWKYFSPGKSIPKLLLHIEDTDLWKFKLKFTKELLAALDLYGYEFSSWDRIAKDFENGQKIKKYIEMGRIILLFQKIIIGQLVKDADRVVFNGYKTLAVNSPLWNSEIGHILANKLPPIGIIWFQRNGRICVSLRSNGKVDVSELAKRYNGGGHKAAAGFDVDTKNGLPWKMID